MLSLDAERTALLPEWLAYVAVVDGLLAGAAVAWSTGQQDWVGGPDWLIASRCSLLCVAVVAVPTLVVRLLRKLLVPGVLPRRFGMGLTIASVLASALVASGMSATRVSIMMAI